MGIAKGHNTHPGNHHHNGIAAAHGFEDLRDGFKDALYDVVGLFAGVLQLEGPHREASKRKRGRERERRRRKSLGILPAQTC